MRLLQSNCVFTIFAISFMNCLLTASDKELVFPPAAELQENFRNSGLTVFTQKMKWFIPAVVDGPKTLENVSLQVTLALYNYEQILRDEGKSEQDATFRAAMLCLQIPLIYQILLSGSPEALEILKQRKR